MLYSDTQLQVAAMTEMTKNELWPGTVTYLFISS